MVGFFPLNICVLGAEQSVRTSLRSGSEQVTSDSDSLQLGHPKKSAWGLFINDTMILGDGFGGPKLQPGRGQKGPWRWEIPFKEELGG